ncbi:MAG: glycosyltransferase family 9 protein [Lentisphaerae bacterium]|jgi:lipopolysaccharide heptosyltransferase II|nr:glycosyltransferase family 9 protein [Lentisphaerota bacterium]
MAEERQILVIKLSSLGDVLHALPAVAELKNQLGAKIHWAVQPEFADLVHCFSCVDKVIPIPRPTLKKAYINALRNLRSSGIYEMVVDFQGLIKSGIVARTACTSRRIGPSFTREGAQIFYTEVTGKKNKNRHAVEECLDIVTHLKLKYPDEPCFPLSVPDIDIELLAKKLPYRGPLIALAPVSRWESKNWPKEYFAELLKSLAGNHDARVCLIGGRADREVADYIISTAGVSALNFCGEHSLIESMGVLSKCEVLVSNDSGPMHMGAALGTRCVVPFGPTLPERTGPYGKKHTVLRAAGCTPCHKRVCPRGTLECMRSITPSMMEDAIFEPAATA